MPVRNRIAWRMPTAAEAVAMGIVKADGTLDVERHLDIAAAAIVRIEDPRHPLNARADDVAKACGLSVAAARKRATDRGLSHR